MLGVRTSASPCFGGQSSTVNKHFTGPPGSDGLPATSVGPGVRLQILLPASSREGQGLSQQSARLTGVLCGVGGWVAAPREHQQV